jgi:hypothetical protein
MFTLERAHQLLRQQGLEGDEDFEVHSPSRLAKEGGVSSNWKLFKGRCSDLPPSSSLQSISALTISPQYAASESGTPQARSSPLRLMSAVVIGTAIGSLLASLIS